MKRQTPHARGTWCDAHARLRVAIVPGVTAGEFVGENSVADLVEVPVVWPARLHQRPVRAASKMCDTPHAPDSSVRGSICRTGIRF
jgi:hypothetical protein